MRRILLRVAIAVLAFGLGVFVDVFWRAYTFDDGPAFDLSAIQPLLANSEDIRIVGGLNASGPSGSTDVYELSDGGRVMITCELYVSPSAANRELHTRAVGRMDMIEWSENVDDDGQSVGQTIVFMSPTVVRLSTERSRLCETNASSVKHLRLIENSQR